MSVFFIKLQSTSSEHVEPAALEHTNAVVLVQVLTDALYPLGQFGVSLMQSTDGQLCPLLLEEELPFVQEPAPTLQEPNRIQPTMLI